MNFYKNDEEYELAESCNWELIQNISQVALISIRAEIDMLAFQLSKEGLNLDSKNRIKSFDSVIAKCEEKGLEPTFENITTQLHDIAAARIIVPTIKDVYKIRDLLASRLTIVEVRDYIENPKRNGYRSLHLIIEEHVSFSGVKHSVKAELQIRTHAQNCWSVLEHDLGYKNENQTPKSEQYFMSLADLLCQVDENAMKLAEEKERIDSESK